jgi:CubicO group peptidase (beta-lactamase class C family)
VSGVLRSAGRVVLVLLVAGTVWLNVDYWRDPVYWRRWWDLVTHLEPDHMNFSPTAAVQSSRVYFPPRAAAGDLTVEPGALREAEAYAERFGSFALIVVHRGVVQTDWYGQGWHADRLTQSQSMMKTLTGLMVGLAIADGHIGSTEDRIGRYIDEWDDDPRGDITVENLLQMSTGLAQYRFTLNPFARDSSFRFLNSADRVPVLLDTPLEWAPGSKFDYNDVDAQLAGLIVERAAGQPYTSYVRERLWDPLGGQYARFWLDRVDGSAMTACCLLSPAMNWARIGLMMKDGGVLDGRQVVPAEWIERMLGPSPAYAGYGYFTWLAPGLGDQAEDVSGSFRQSEPFAADDVFMLAGYGGQRVYVSRRLDLVVVRLGPFAGMQPLGSDWDNAQLFNIVARGLRAPAVPQRTAAR